MAQKDIGDRISSVKNVQKITRAMEMVAAARLRKAEQRIEVLRPYADAIRRMARQATQSADNVPDMPVLQEHDTMDTVGLLLVTSDRGLAGSFNSQIIRAGIARARELRADGKTVLFWVSGKRGASSMNFRGEAVEDQYQDFTDRPAFSDARNIGQDLVSAYTDEKVDRVETFYNGYVSPMQQNVRHEVLLPLQQAEFLGEEGDDEDDEDGEDDESQDQGPDGGEAAHDQERSLWIYEPDPGEILRRLAPDFVEVSIYRALLESTASEHGARMTAMRSAADNADELIDDLQLEANRQRQSEITQQLMEIVAGAEALS